MYVLKKKKKKKKNLNRYNFFTKPIMVKCLNIGKNIGKPIYRSISNKYRFRHCLGSGSGFFIIRHIHNHTSIISSEMQVELKKNTAFT